MRPTSLTWSWTRRISDRSREWLTRSNATLIFTTKKSKACTKNSEISENLRFAIFPNLKPLTLEKNNHENSESPHRTHRRCHRPHDRRHRSLGHRPRHH